MFNEAERRWAETMERIARQQHSADLLAMAAEALMIPEAWNLKQVLPSCSLQHLPVIRGLEVVPRCQSAHKERRAVSTPSLGCAHRVRAPPHRELKTAAPVQLWSHCQNSDITTRLILCRQVQLCIGVCVCL